MIFEDLGKIFEDPWISLRIKVKIFEDHDKNCREPQESLNI